MQKAQDTHDKTPCEDTQHVDGLNGVERDRSGRANGERRAVHARTHTPLHNRKGSEAHVRDKSGQYIARSLLAKPDGSVQTPTRRSTWAHDAPQEQCPT
jgi:hypothetical protein